MSGAYDRGKLVELFGDDASAVAAIEREFLDTAREAAVEIRGSEDLERIAKAAHRVKGASGMIGADALSRVAAAIEQAARARDLSAVRELDTRFSDEVTRVASQVAAA